MPVFTNMSNLECVVRKSLLPVSSKIALVSVFASGKLIIAKFLVRTQS